MGIYMSDTELGNECNEKGKILNTEDSILLKLTEILEREHFITIDERNRAVDLIEKGGMR